MGVFLMIFTAFQCAVVLTLLAADVGLYMRTKKRKIRLEQLSVGEKFRLMLSSVKGGKYRIVRYLRPAAKGDKKFLRFYVACLKIESFAFLSLVGLFVCGAVFSLFWVLFANHAS